MKGGPKSFNNKHRNVASKLDKHQSIIEKKFQVEELIETIYNKCFETIHVKDYQLQLQTINSLLQPLFFPKDNNLYVVYGQDDVLKLDFQYFDNGHLLGLISLQSILVSLSLMKQQNISQFDDLDITFEQIFISEEVIEIFIQVISIETLNQKEITHLKNLQFIQYLKQNFDQRSKILTKQALQYYMTAK